MKRVIIAAIILIPLTYIGYWIWRWYKFVNSGTWQGTLTGVATFLLIVAILGISGFFLEKHNERQLKIQRKKWKERHDAQQKEYEEELRKDREYVAKHDPTGKAVARIQAEIDKMYRDAGLPTPAEQKAKEEAARAAAEAREHERLRKAQASGQDVCYKCHTIGPRRCKHCDCCMTCLKETSQYCSKCKNINLCGDPTCGGWCHICDDDDDDYYNW